MNEKDQDSALKMLLLDNETIETIIESLEIRLNRVEFLNELAGESQKLDTVEERVRNSLEEFQDEKN